MHTRGNLVIPSQGQQIKPEVSQDR